MTVYPIEKVVSFERLRVCLNPKLEQFPRWDRSLDTSHAAPGLKYFLLQWLTALDACVSMPHGWMEGSSTFLNSVFMEESTVFCPRVYSIFLYVVCSVHRNMPAGSPRMKGKTSSSSSESYFRAQYESVCKER